MSLNGFHTSQSGMFVIGSPAVEDKNISFTDAEVFATKKFDQGPSVETNLIQISHFIPATDQVVGVALTYHVGTLPQFELSPKNPSLPLIRHRSKKRIELLTNHIVDMTVFTREGLENTCSIFETLHDEWNSKKPLPIKYLLRHVNPTNGIASLNRCTISSDGFQPSSFLLGPPTPSAVNNCNSHLKAYSLLDNVQNLAQAGLDQGNIDVGVEVADLEEGYVGFGGEPMEACSSDPADVALVEATGFNEVESIVQGVFEGLDDNTDVGLENTALETYELSRADSRFFGLFGDLADLPFELVNDEYNDYCDSPQMRQDMQNIKHYQNILIDHKLIERPHVCTWFRYLFNVDFPSKSTYQCKYGADHYIEYGFDPLMGPALAKKSGELGSTFKKNNELINNHFKDPRHIKVMQTYVIKKASTISDLYFTLQSRQDVGENSEYAATNRRFRSILTTAQEGWSLRSFKKLLKLQRINGLPVGDHYLHYRGVYKMLEFMYNEDHNKLIEHLMSDDNHISLIVDTATDITKTHYLIVLFQKLERHTPVVYFYKILRLGSDETAAGLRDTLINQFKKEKEGFILHLKNHLLGIATDGASVMTAENGFGKLMEKWVREDGLGRRLFIYHDAGHRYELIFKRALHDDDFSNFFETKFNDMYSYVNSKSHKITAYFRELAKGLEEHFVQLAYHYEIRWCTSHLDVLKKVKKSYRALCRGLNAIMNNRKKFNAKQREEASVLYDFLTDRRFPLQLNFRIDILSEMSITSKLQQKRGALIFDKARSRDRLIAVFEEMRVNDGPSLKASFRNDLHSECYSRHCVRDGASQEEFLYQADRAFYMGIELGPKISLDYDVEMPRKLMDVRNDTIDDLQAELKTYFPDGEVSKFHIFDPLEMPKKESEAETFGAKEIIEVSKLFGFKENDREEIRKEWAFLLKELVRDPEYYLVKESPANIFWYFYFNTNRVLIKPKIKHVLEMGLSLACSSSDAERGFSQVTATKTKRRTRMGDDLLNFLMHFNIDVSDDLEQFPALTYSKKWKAAGNWLVDDPTPPHKKKKLEDWYLKEIDEESWDTERLLSGKTCIY